MASSSVSVAAVRFVIVVVSVGVVVAFVHGVPTTTGGAVELGIVF